VREAPHRSEEPLWRWCSTGIRAGSDGGTPLVQGTGFKHGASSPRTPDGDCAERQAGPAALEAGADVLLSNIEPPERLLEMIREMKGEKR
jgi:hypothetical protein